MSVSKFATIYKFVNNILNAHARHAL